MKQHRLFCAEERRDPRILRHMQRAGHLEFGLDRRAINVGDTAKAQGIEALWREGQEVRGWARYWAMLYGFVLDQRDADPALERAVMMVRYEDLCDRAEATLEAAFAHVELAIDPVSRASDGGTPEPAHLLRPRLHGRGRGGDRRRNRRHARQTRLRLTFIRAELLQQGINRALALRARPPSCCNAANFLVGRQSSC